MKYKIALLVGLLLAGCTTIPQASFTTLETTLPQVHAQAIEAFNEANALALEASEETVLSTTRPVIVEDDFTPAISPQSIAEWDAVFSKMEKYVSALQQLNSSGKDGKFTGAVGDLGKELQTSKIGGKITPTVTSAVGYWGSELISAAAESDALHVAKKADPGVRKTFSEMASAIGGNNREGLRGVVWSNWEARLAIVTLDYSKATSEKNLECRKKSIADFLDLMKQRDKELNALGNLHQSLMLLADAHTCLANGKKEDAAAVISLLGDQITEIKTIMTDIHNTEKVKAKGEANEPKSVPTTRDSAPASQPAATGDVKLHRH